MESESRTKVRRHPERGSGERAVIDAILDEGFLCHVGFVEDEQPFVIPTLYTRVGDVVYLHGSPLSRMLGRLGSGAPLCVTVTLLDGLVLARSAFSSSVNYRSVVILGQGRVVKDPAEEREAMRALVDQVVPGRAREAREPNARELAATVVVAVPIEEASAKIRTGPPKDTAEDQTLNIWAGEIPLSLQRGEPVPDAALPPHIPLPPSARRPGLEERA